GHAESPLLVTARGRSGRRLWLIAAALVIAFGGGAAGLVLTRPAGPHQARLVEYRVPTPSSSPSGLTRGPAGLWFTEADGNKVARVSPSGRIGEFAIPTPGSVPSGIAEGSDGAMWFAEYLANKIGRVTQAGSVVEFPLPTADARPGDVIRGPDGAIW